MSKLEPIDDGVRRFRPGLMIVLFALILAIGGGVLFQKVMRKQAPAQEKTSPPTIAEQVEEIRNEPALPAPPPPPPSIHPLEGKRRLFLADGCRYRFHELTFTRDFSEQHDLPGAILRADDPCLWNFVGVPDKEDVYRIFCADPNFPELHQANLTYTRVVDDGNPQDELSPYLTLRSDDPCEWQIKTSAINPTHYELYCLSGKAPFLDESLSWIAEQEDLKDDFITATLGQYGTPSWWILPEDQTPILPRRASHLIVINRGSIKNLEQSREDFEEHGHEIFRVQFETAEDDFTRSAEDLNYLKLVKAIRNSDPIINHPDFPALLGMSPADILNGQISLQREDPLFPLIIPLKVALHPHLILELKMENTEFWKNTWESLDDFQSHLDESPSADGRIYHGDRFTYIFVSWEP